MTNKSIKLSILIYSMAGGGAERVISYFLTFLKNKNIEVHLVLMNSTVLYKIPKEIPVHYLEKSKSNENGIYKLAKLPLLAYRYAMLLEKIGVTHSLSLLSRPNYINLLVKLFITRNYKFIISERNYPSVQYASGSLKNSINKYLIRKFYPTADFIVCNSQANGQDLIKNFNCDESKIQVIYNPIDRQKIEKIKPIVDFFDPNYFNVISVARFHPEKNHKLLIRAVKSLSNVRLYILGEGALRAELESLIKEENLVDKIFLLGFDSNPYKYLKSADLFALSSNNEGFPNVLLEAMACRLPIISTNCKSGPSELMKLKEEKNDLMFTDYGLLVPIKNTDLMTKGIRYLSTNSYYLQSCKKNCAKRVLDYEKEPILNEFFTAIENS